MNRLPVVGLLPLYLKLYDDVLPDARQAFDPFLDRVVEGLEAGGVAVARAPVCRLAEEVRSGVEALERTGADLLVTLHLAYSPSLESVDALVASPLPLVLLDTTMHYDFGVDADPARILYNHGIHGVQDLASMLRRRGRPYRVVAGHVAESEVLARVAGMARAARAAANLRTMRVLRIGETFRGMGDFAVDDGLLEARLGVQVTQIDTEPLKDHVRRVPAEAVEEEMRSDRARYVADVPEEVHRRSVRVGLGLRRLVDEGGFGAFSQNFLAFDSPEEPVDTVPFLEASKAMARGLGYAGEGDVLTAALVGAVNAAFGRTGFTEMFCPDWRGGSVFLSHMGECNPLCSDVPAVLLEKDFPWAGARNPAILTAPPAPGSAVLVNLAPGPSDTFDLILAPVWIMGDATHPAMRNAIRGWMRPEIDLIPFLEEYSRFGGTHHCALVHSASIEALASFAEFAGLGCHVIGGGAARAGAAAAAPREGSKVLEREFA